MGTTDQTVRHILYLEDDWQNVHADFSHMEDVLSVQFHFAKNFTEIQDILQTCEVDLFVLDIEIEGERRTGIQLAEQLRQIPKYRQTPILFTSMHRHFSYSLLSKIRRCAFLAKPFSDNEFITQVGIALEVPAYIDRHYTSAKLLLPQGNTYIEVDPLNISYIEGNRRKFFTQLITGDSISITSQSGTLKNILTQIETQNIHCLRQIYRSIIVNVNQIKNIYIEKNIGRVFLFNDSDPKPIGMQYRHNLHEFL